MTGLEQIAQTGNGGLCGGLSHPISRPRSSLHLSKAEIGDLGKRLAASEQILAQWQPGAEPAWLD